MLYLFDQEINYPARVKIREHIPDDLEYYLEWQTDPTFSKFLTWLPRSTEDATSNLNEAIRQQTLKNRTIYFFAVVDRKSDNILGDIGFTITDYSNADCGWFIRKSCQGNGYATEAVEQMIRYAFEHLNLKTLSASCRKENLASVRIMAKCGFKLKKQSEDRLWYFLSRDDCPLTRKDKRTKKD